MVMTRRASLLERQRSESVAIGEKPAVENDNEGDIKPRSVARDSPSLLRPTPQLEVPDVKPAGDDDDIVQALSAITITVKDEPVDIEDIVVQPPHTSTSTAFSLDLASPPPVVKSEVIEIASDEEEEARDTVGAMRPLAALPARARGRNSSAGSVVSVEDAKTSIDDFMMDREAFTADEDNKLRFWQSLCIEFRLVKVEGAPIPWLDQPPTGSTGETWSDTPDLPPVPTTCTEANKLLKAKAHVNLVDYFKARLEPLAAGEERDYTHLLFPSRDAVVEYTRRHKKFIPKEDAKEDLLQPLLKTMRRGARR